MSEERRNENKVWEMHSSLSFDNRLLGLPFYKCRITILQFCSLHTLEFLQFSSRHHHHLGIEWTFLSHDTCTKSWFRLWTSDLMDISTVKLAISLRRVIWPTLALCRRGRCSPCRHLLGPPSPPPSWPSTSWCCCPSSECRLCSRDWPASDSLGLPPCYTQSPWLSSPCCCHCICTEETG